MRFKMFTKRCVSEKTCGVRIDSSFDAEMICASKAKFEVSVPLVPREEEVIEV
jgi:hypothetical protein